MIQWLRCLFGYHRLHVVGRPTAWSHHLRCCDCRKEFGHSWASGRDSILPWAEIASYYRERGYRP